MAQLTRLLGGALLLQVALFAGAVKAQDARRSLTVEFSFDHRDKTFPAGSAISFRVVLHALSVEDRNDFESLVIDDWRYDTPNYFTDHRCPNVVLHVERFENARWEPVGFRASSQGGGGDLEKADVSVDIYIGGEPPYGGNKPGRYRITPTYTGLLKNKRRVLLTTEPVEVTVK